MSGLNFDPQEEILCLFPKLREDFGNYDGTTRPLIKEREAAPLLAAMADRELDKVPVPRTFEQTVKNSRSSKIDALILTVPNLHTLAREHFSDRLLLEFSSAEPNRKCFNLFFGYCFSKVREELREEFKTFVSPDDFEMCVRDALAFYEGA